MIQLPIYCSNTQYALIAVTSTINRYRCTACGFEVSLSNNATVNFPASHPVFGVTSLLKPTTAENYSEVSRP